VCVQSRITSVAFTYEQLAVKTGVPHKFNYDVAEGTEVFTVVDYGDGTIEENNGTTGVCFIETAIFIFLTINTVWQNL